jgi:hypothetical protein
MLKTQGLALCLKQVVYVKKKRKKSPYRSMVISITLHLISTGRRIRAYARWPCSIQPDFSRIEP